MSSEWKAELEFVLEDWSSLTSRKVIISPDVDGLISTVVLNKIYPLEIIGIYTTTHLLMLGDFTTQDAKDALWLDHDVSAPGVRCIGQHLVLHEPENKLPLRHQISWNPNNWMNQSWKHSFAGISGKKRDKYPYGTAHFLWDLIEKRKVSDVEMALLAHADGTWFALDLYKANGTIWKGLMFPDSAWVDTLLTYRDQHQFHGTHNKVVQSLQNMGYSSASRSPRAKLLEPDLKNLVGKQSLTISMKSNSQKYLDRIIEGLKYVSSVFESYPKIESKAGKVISGNRKPYYPNRIEEFDRFMEDEQIFSHAFTDQRTLSFTTGIKL